MEVTLNVCENCNYVIPHCDCDNEGKFREDLYDSDEDLLVSDNRCWEDVDEVLPDIGDPVLILTEYGKMATAKCINKSKPDYGWVDWMRGQHSYGSVTHWMPLPKPPTE